MCLGRLIFYVLRSLLAGCLKCLHTARLLPDFQEYAILIHKNDKNVSTQRKFELKVVLKRGRPLTTTSPPCPHAVLSADAETDDEMCILFYMCAAR